MKLKFGLTCGAVLGCVLLMGADGAWLQRVPPADHARTSPLGKSPAELESAAASGAQTFRNNCAKCHGNDAMGKYSRPPLISSRVTGATDGDLFWILSNGNPWKGMPPWTMLPAKERWQLVAYLRALNSADTTTGAPSPQPTQSQRNPQ